MILFFSRKRHIASEREKAEMPNFGPTIIPEPDTSTPSTPVGKKPMLLRNMPIYLFLPISRLLYEQTSRAIKANVLWILELAQWYRSKYL